MSKKKRKYLSQEKIEEKTKKNKEVLKTFQKWVKGKTIKKFTSEEDGVCVIKFKDGSSVKMYAVGIMASLQLAWEEKK